MDEFQMNEKVLKEMKQEVESYQKKGKIEAANRLRDQVSLLEERFEATQAKLNRFTSPQVNFESRLNRALGELRNVERSSCILDVASAGPHNVHDQFKHCLKMYRTLSEVKGEIENVIKTGRKVCEDKATRHPKKLSLSIDALKHLYNALGEHVTKSKINLENLLKLSNALQMNLNTIEKWIDYMEKFGKNEEKRSLPADVLGLSTEQIKIMIDECNDSCAEYVQLCEPIYLEETRLKIDELTDRFARITNFDIGKNLLEIQSTLQNLDNISMDTLRYVGFDLIKSGLHYHFLILSICRNIETDLQNMDISNSEVKKLHNQVTNIVQVSFSRMHGKIGSFSAHKHIYTHISLYSHVKFFLLSVFYQPHLCSINPLLFIISLCLHMIEIRG